jgi:hypothetical protein
MLTEVQKILEELLLGARAVLGAQFVGMYLYGSLSSGDFNPASSDIDFVIITETALLPETVAALEALHQRLWAEGSYWAAHLEGAYVPRADWRRYDPAMRPVPTVNEGRFVVGGLGSDWVLQRHVVREAGVTLAGPPPASLLDPVSPAELRAAVAGILREAWAGFVNDPAFLSRADYQAFAVLTMCRALYVLEQGTFVSKPAAARWALSALPQRWHSLIQQAAAWNYGAEEIGQVEDIQALIRYTVAQTAAAGPSDANHY